MYYTRCLHPPGGASALAAVVGGPAIQSLGYAYLVTPLLLNLIALLGIAMLFNAPFAHRRYPVRQAAPLNGEKAMIAHSDLVYALSEIDSFIDVSEDDLVRIYNLAMQHAGTERERKTRAVAS
jgi:CBS-domain-containing membrane protein